MRTASRGSGCWKPSASSRGISCRSRTRSGCRTATSPTSWPLPSDPSPNCGDQTKPYGSAGSRQSRPTSGRRSLGPQEAHRDESMLRLAAALRRRFWHDAGGLGEGLRWLEASLAVAADAPAALRVKAQQRLAWILWEMGDSERSQELFEASLRAADDDDHRSRIEALIGLSHRALGAGGPELDAAAERMAAAIEHTRHDGTPGALVEPLLVAGQLAQARGELAQARTQFEEALDLARAAGDVWGAASALTQGGALALLAGEHAHATALLAESVRLSVE